jgi:hypothetical protein
VEIRARALRRRLKVASDVPAAVEDAVVAVDPGAAAKRLEGLRHLRKPPTRKKAVRTHRQKGANRKRRAKGAVAHALLEAGGGVAAPQVKLSRST